MRQLFHKLQLLQMLKKYCKYLEDKQIPYYWNKKLNLLEHANSVNFTNIANATRNIIQKIERSPNDPKVLLDYLCEYFFC